MWLVMYVFGAKDLEQVRSHYRNMVLTEGHGLSKETVGDIAVKVEPWGVTQVQFIGLLDHLDELLKLNPGGEKLFSDLTKKADELQLSTSAQVVLLQYIHDQLYMSQIIADPGKIFEQEFVRGKDTWTESSISIAGTHTYAANSDACLKINPDPDSIALACVADGVSNAADDGGDSKRYLSGRVAAHAITEAFSKLDTNDVKDADAYQLNLKACNLSDSAATTVSQYFEKILEPTTFAVVKLLMPMEQHNNLLSELYTELNVPVADLTVLESSSSSNDAQQAITSSNQAAGYMSLGSSSRVVSLQQTNADPIAQYFNSISTNEMGIRDLLKRVLGDDIYFLLKPMIKVKEIADAKVKASYDWKLLPENGLAFGSMFSAVLDLGNDVGLLSFGDTNAVAINNDGMKYHVSERIQGAMSNYCGTLNSKEIRSGFGRDISPLRFQRIPKADLGTIVLVSDGMYGKFKKRENDDFKSFYEAIIKENLKESSSQIVSAAIKYAKPLQSNDDKTITVLKKLAA